MLYKTWISDNLANLTGSNHLQVGLQGSCRVYKVLRISGLGALGLRIVS